ncbi:hypothetical protein ABZ517_05695 [Streptomyces scabiei]|uniref:hypothetical protein n=1 Tax=Streptomyces scabiei TaxID=1930 RepID=UPI0033DA53C7
MPREKKLSDSAFLILASVSRGWVHRSTTFHSDIWHISPGRGNGHKAIGRTPAGQKLIRDGLLTDESFPKLTDEGRAALTQATQEGRRLNYGVGRKPRVVKAEEKPTEGQTTGKGPKVLRELLRLEG